MSTTRRTFLAGAGAMLAAPSLLARSRARQDDGGTPLLVVVFLRGGADFLNMVVPVGDPTYALVRPTIGLTEEDGLLPLEDDFALHPALAPLEPLWDDGELAAVTCVGSPHVTRSHFDAQDFMERGAPGMRHVTTGWLNRYLQVTRREDESELRAVALQNLLPRALRGDYPALALPPGLGRKLDAETLAEFEDLYGDAGSMETGPEEAGEVLASGRATIGTLRRLQEILDAPPSDEGIAWPRSAFARSLRSLATLARADCGLEVAAVDYPGWDHHINQGGVQGTQARMLADYAASLAAFRVALGPRMERTLVVTMTEFGRTVAENGNNGSDHGRGGGMFLLGGGVRGGRVHGRWKGLEPKVLADGRDLPVTTDFRDVLAASLGGLFGFDVPKGFFPDYKPGSIALF
jgi:uncharacterized protein (DUF1501 family)